MFGYTKVKLESDLVSKIKRYADIAGYSSVEEFITHALEKEVAKLCRIAATVDNGTFEGAGFKFHADTWEPGREGCCHLHIRPGEK